MGKDEMNKSKLFLITSHIFRCKKIKNFMVLWCLFYSLIVTIVFLYLYILPQLILEHTDNGILPFWASFFSIAIMSAICTYVIIIRNKEIKVKKYMYSLRKSMINNMILFLPLSMIFYLLSNVL